MLLPLIHNRKSLLLSVEKIRIIGQMSSQETYIYHCTRIKNSYSDRFCLCCLSSVKISYHLWRDRDPGSAADSCWRRGWRLVWSKRALLSLLSSTVNGAIEESWCSVNCVSLDPAVYVNKYLIYDYFCVNGFWSKWSVLLSTLPVPMPQKAGHNNLTGKFGLGRSFDISIIFW